MTSDRALELWLKEMIPTWIDVNHCRSTTKPWIHQGGILGSHQDSQIMGPKCHGEVTFLSLALLSLGSFHEGLVDVIGKLLVYIVFVLLVCGFAKWSHFCKETILEKQ